MRKIGLFGGTFDPIHLGHLQVAADAQRQLQLDEVRFIPCHQPAHKAQPLASAHHRVAMITQGIQPYPSFRCDTCELERDQPSYTLDTLIHLRNLLGHDIGFYWLIGADAFSQIDQWSRWEQLLDYTHFVVMERAGEKVQFTTPSLPIWLQTHRATIAEAIHQTHGHIIECAVTPMTISSSDIRKRLMNRESVDSLLAPSVIQYVQQHSLYTEPTPSL